MVDCFVMEVLPVDILKIPAWAPWNFGVLGTTWSAKAGLLVQKYEQNRTFFLGQCYECYVPGPPKGCFLEVFGHIKGCADSYVRTL